GRCDMLVPEEEIEQRKLEGTPAVPESVTPWQELYRATVGQLDGGAIVEAALKYRGVAAQAPRHNHLCASQIAPLPALLVTPIVTLTAVHASDSQCIPSRSVSAATRNACATWR